MHCFAVALHAAGMTQNAHLQRRAWRMADALNRRESGLGTAYGGRAPSQVPVATRQGLAFIVVAELTGRSDLASYLRLGALPVVFSSCFLLP